MWLAEGQACPLCEGSRLNWLALPVFSGDEAPLRVTLHAMPALQCPVGHTYFVKREFPFWLTNQLLAEDAPTLPEARASGFLLKRYACGGCGAPLPRASRPHALRFELSYERSAGFTVELSVPAYRCAGCGTEQLRSRERLRSLTPAALVHAFKGAGLKAPG